MSHPLLVSDLGFLVLLGVVKPRCDLSCEVFVQYKLAKRTTKRAQYTEYIPGCEVEKRKRKRREEFCLSGTRVCVNNKYNNNNNNNKQQNNKTTTTSTWSLFNKQILFLSSFPYLIPFSNLQHLFYIHLDYQTHDI